MENYVLFTDSTTDLTPELVEELGIQVIPMTFNINDHDYHNYPDNREMDAHDFYEALRNGGMSTTSQINQVTFMDTFSPVLEQGKDVLYLGFSSGLSGTFHSATLAAEELKEQFPDRTIKVIDTLQASMGQALAVYYAAKQMQSGHSIQDISDWFDQNKLRVCAWFTVDDLMFLKRGGRLSAGAALAGTLLGIKPVLHVDNEGKLIPMEKVRGRRASLDSLVNHLKSSEFPLNKQVVFISHGDCLEDAQYVADAVRNLGVDRIEINHIGPVIGAHSGPGTVAIFFLANNR